VSSKDYLHKNAAKTGAKQDYHCFISQLMFRCEIIVKRDDKGDNSWTNARV